MRLALLALVAACHAPAEARPPTGGTVLVTLGTRGGPMPTKGRTQSANLLIVNGTLYLIDAGDGVTQRIVQAGNDFRRVDKVFLTHLHGDHTAGLATLIGAAWEYQRRAPIDVYGSGAERLVAGAIDYLTPNAEIKASNGKRTALTDVVRGHDVVPGLVYQDANVKVTAVENTHFHGVDKYRSYAYRFETADRAIVFTGDTGPSEAVTELARGADVLVTEVGDPDAVIALAKQNGTWDRKTPAEREGLERHLRDEHLVAAEVGKLAARAQVKSVVMTHLVPTPDPDDTYARYIAQARPYFTGPIAIADDLARF